MACSAEFMFWPPSGQDSSLSLVVAQWVSDHLADLVRLVTDSVRLEGRAHGAGVLCSSTSLAGDMLDLVSGHSLRKVAGRLECLDDLLFSRSDIDKE